MSLTVNVKIKDKPLVMIVFDIIFQNEILKGNEIEVQLMSNDFCI